MRSVVWSALRTGSNTDAFLGGFDSDSRAEQPLLERSAAAEASLTSAGLDGEAPKTQSGAISILHLAA